METPAHARPARPGSPRLPARASALALALALAGTGGAAGERDPGPAAAELATVRAALARYADFAVAEAEGWRPFGGDEPLMGQHFFHPDGPDYVHGDPLDYARPSNLMYTEMDGRMVLTGASFNVRLGPGEPVPEGFPGDADVWHVHDFEAAIAAATEERPVLRWLAGWWLDGPFGEGGDGRMRLAMVHVWFEPPNPDGPFADHNRLLPYLELGLPLEHAEGASLAAARGLALATPDGCENALAGRLWIADVSWRVGREIMRGCEAAAARAAVALGEPAAALNAAGEAAWAEVSALLDARLTGDQKRRIEAMVEHGSHGGDGGHSGHH